MAGSDMPGLVTPRDIQRALANLEPNFSAFRAGTQLWQDYWNFKDESPRNSDMPRLKQGGELVLVQALYGTLRQLERDEVLVQCIMSREYRDGYNHGRLGEVSHELLFLAVVDAAYFLWTVNRDGVAKFSLNDYIEIPPSFRGDLKDLNGHIIVQSTQSRSDADNDD